MEYSVCMSVYRNDNPEYLRLALDSMLRQTLPPKELVIVQDGTVSQAISDVLTEYANSYANFRVIPLDVNQGLGIARKIGVEHCSCEYIAVMDADDIAQPNRMELQMKFMADNPHVDLVGGQIAEFIDSSENIVGFRNVPLTDEEIKKYVKYRCPINHMTVTFRKQSVIKAGNYQHWHYNEDYYLWIRMFLNNAIFANLPEELVRVRVGKDMYARRGGWKYFKSEAKLQRFMLSKGVISLPLFIYNVFGRFVIQILLPNKFRGFLFQKVFRKKVL